MKTEKYLCNDRKYRYIYKITIIPTNQYYFGQHTLKQINDDQYMGSGSELNKIYELSGFNIANKEICCYAESEDELNKLEKDYIGTKYKDDPLCLNKIPGGSYKRDDALKHEVAILGGKALAAKLKTDLLFAKQYKEHQRKKEFEFMADKERYNKMNEQRSQKLKDFFKRNGPVGYCLNNGRIGKIQITNDFTLETKFINKTDILPTGWRYGKPRKDNDAIITDHKPSLKLYFKCFSIFDCSIIYVRKDCSIPANYIKAPLYHKNSKKIRNTLTSEVIMVPNECNIPNNWEIVKYKSK